MGLWLQHCERPPPQPAGYCKGIVPVWIAARAHVPYLQLVCLQLVYLQLVRLQLVCLQFVRLQFVRLQFVRLQWHSHDSSDCLLIADVLQHLQPVLEPVHDCVGIRIV
jgi:hypothetical protein